MPTPEAKGSRLSVASQNASNEERGLHAPFSLSRFPAGVLSHAGFEPTLGVYPTNEGHITMGKILSKISGPLLIGSILALGALAFPVHSHAADGPLFVFRASSGVLPMQVANNGNGDTGGGAETSPGSGEGETGGGSGDGGEAGSGSDDTGGTETPAGQALLKISFADGWSFECKTNWSADLATYRPLIENATQRDYDAEKDEIFYVGTAPATATGNADAWGSDMAFRFTSSVFGFDWRAPMGWRAPGDNTGPWEGAEGSVYSMPPTARDPREFPPSPPCVSSTNFSVEVGTYRPGESSSLPILNVQIVTQ